jgi:NAD(P)-dependent dehydrogenase (short-subunit alcohol dehydrogenase family)
MTPSKYVSRVDGHALVLGGSGGLGTEVVRALAASGASALSFTYGRNRAAAEKLADDLRSLRVRTFIGPLDQSNEASVKQLLTDATSAAGREIDVAVNTVGISPNVPIEAQTLDGRDGWRNVFEVNVFGCFISTRAIAERMKARGVRGTILLITSTNGINSQSQISTHYDASKAAQGHMMKIFAEHYAGAGIRINGLAPGWIDTHLNDTLPADERAKELGKIWAGRFAEPAEIAAFAAFLCGSGASYAYGQNFMVDGGYR